MIERKKPYEKPEMRAVEIQQEVLLQVGSYGIEPQSDFGKGDGNGGWNKMYD